MCRTAEGEPRYLCPMPGCDKSFKNPLGLDYHAAHFYHPPGPLLRSAFPEDVVTATLSAADADPVSPSHRLTHFAFAR